MTESNGMTYNGKKNLATKNV